MSTATRPAARPRCTGVGMTGIPIVNVNNNCSTGSTALFLARQAVASGAADCVLALGFEQMQPGALGAVFDDRPSPFEPVRRGDARELGDVSDVPVAAQLLRRRRARAHADSYGTRPGGVRQDLGEGPPARREQPATRCSATRSPSRRCWRSPHIWPADAAAVLPAHLRRGRRGDRVSEAFARRHGLRPTCASARRR